MHAGKLAVVAKKNGFTRLNALGKGLGILGLGLLLFSCTSSPGMTRATIAPTWVPYEECEWVWGRQPIPPLSKAVQDDLAARGVGQVSVSAEVFGSNCLDSHQRVSWTDPLHTDYYLVLEVADIADREALARLSERILAVLERYPAEETPGPWPGVIEILFVEGELSLRLNFSEEWLVQVRSWDLQGTALLDALENPGGQE